MIAAVLLIAFTVAVGGILSVWLPSLIRTSTAGTETQAQATVKCASAGFEVVSADTGNNKVYITMSSSDVEIFPNTIRFSDGTINTTFTANPSVLDSPGEISTITVTYPTDVNSVTVIGLCQYGGTNITIEASCIEKEDCWS
jgi:hypothetical protein